MEGVVHSLDQVLDTEEESTESREMEAGTHLVEGG